MPIAGPLARAPGRIIAGARCLGGRSQGSRQYHGHRAAGWSAR